MSLTTYVNVMQMPALKAVISDAEHKILQDFGVEIKLMPKIIDEVSLTSARQAVLQTALCEIFNITWDTILSNDKKRTIASARQVYMFLCFEVLRFSKNKIADELGRDRTTVLHGIQTIKDLCDVKDPIEETVLCLKEKILEVQ